MLIRLPRLAFEAVFLLKKDKQKFKEHMFAFLTDLKEPEKMLSDYWAKNECRIKKFYFETRKEDDLIASASPEFIVRPMIEKLGIKYLIASPVDFKTGKYYGPNCHGQGNEQAHQGLHGIGKHVKKHFFASFLRK